MTIFCTTFMPQSTYLKSQTRFDVFPLSVDRTYLYSYEYRETHYSLIYPWQWYVDSGTVSFRVLSSINSADTVIQWTVHREENLYHRHIRQSSLYPVDTTYWTKVDSQIVLTERKSGDHELLCSSYIWSFPFSPTLRSVYRYTDSAAFAVGVRYYDIFHEYRYFDSLAFDNNHGMYYRYAYVHSGLTAPIVRTTNIVLLSTSTSVPPTQTAGLHPLDFTLFQNYPNPFNSETTIDIELENDSHTTIQVFDILGRHRATLVQERVSAGRHSFRWRSSNSSSGVYICKVQVERFQKSIALLLLK
jgi:hypothetical protein